MDFDQLQQKLGGGDLSSYQIWSFVFVLFAVMGPGYAGQLAVMFSAVPEYRCSFPDGSQFLENFTEEEIMNLTVPYSSEKEKYERCFQFKINHNSTNCNHTDCIDYHEEWRTCEHGYIYSKEHFEETAVSEFNLVCDRQYLDTIVNTIFCVGYACGSIVSGPLSDWFGRKKALMIHCFFYTLFGITMSLSFNFPMFLIFRFLTASSGIAAYLTSVTYVTEFCLKEHRSMLILICSMTQSIGHVLVPVIGYFFRSWRIIGLVGSVIPLSLIFFYPFIPESPRWLLSTGRNKEAKKIVRKLARSHNTKLDENDWDKVVSSVETQSENFEDVKKYTMLDLFRGKRIRFVSMIVAQAWFTTSVLFYGMTLNIGNFFGNPYLNGFINAGIEIFGNLIFLFCSLVGKTRLLSLVFLLAGLACISSTICDIYFKAPMLAVALAVFGKMNAQAILTLVYSVTTEIYPTLVRGTGLSFGSMCSRLGCAITPLTIQLQTTIPWATQTIFGVLGILSSFGSLFLPETTNSEFFPSMFAAEHFYQKKMKLYNKIIGYQPAKEILDENGNLQEIKKLTTEIC